MIYCFDIDGTICTNTDGDYEKAEPYSDRIEKINSLHKDKHRILFYTSRGFVTGIDWRELTEKQLKEWGVKYHELRFGKPGGDIYVDDRTITPTDFTERFSFYQGIAASWKRQHE